MKSPTSLSSGLVRMYNRAVDALSFSGELYRLQRDLNLKIDMPDTIAPPRSKGSSVTRHFRTRRISIAEAYLMVVRDLDSDHIRARLRALRMLADASFHSKTPDMPLNTARVQMALMKEAIKSRHNRRRQLEMLHDFSEASYGRHHFIRKLCKELNIIEVPETGAPLRDLDTGWDLHVHDTSSSGRKNPSQLVIDAFIKGISELTIAYSTVAAVDMMDEALEAGKILGIRVNIGLEFSINAVGRRYHFMALLPDVQSGDGARAFLKKNKHALAPLLKGLEANQQHRIEAVKRLIDNFNRTYLKELNEGYADKLYVASKLKMSALETFMPLTSVNRTHLGEFFYASYRPVIARRVLYLRAQRDRAMHDLRRRRISEWDFGVAERKYTEAFEELGRLSPELLLRRYFTNAALSDYATVFDDVHEVAGFLDAASCGLKLLHPLEHGLEKARKLVETCGDDLDSIEVYNMQDSANRDPDEILRFARFVEEFNEARSRDGKRTIVPVCGSDATGRSPRIPGMGFICVRSLPVRGRKEYVKRHVVLPPMISRMVASARNGGQAGEDAEIVNMGKVSEAGTRNPLSEPGSPQDIVPLSRAIRFANARLKVLLYVTVGFLLAYWYIGIDYAIVWFAITGIRNFIADAVSRRGLKLREWTTRSVDFNNMARSLFWSGLSVPLLGYVKQGFDMIWPFNPSGILFNFATFFAISFANGLYLVAHNKLRGFDPKVVRANFFRSALSWPFASLFAPVGNLFAIPSIVQAKFWSDFVGGIIEGTGKYVRVMKLRGRDVEEIVPRIFSRRSDERLGALAELLYLFRQEPRTRNSLRRLLKAEPEGVCARLKSMFDDDSLYSQLVQFIIAEQGSDMANELVALVGGTFPMFQEWLSNQGSSEAVEPGPDVENRRGLSGA